MRKMLMRKEKGFTLLEVVMVIAIIAVLVAILGPRGLTAYQNAQLDTAAAAQASMKTAVGQSYVKNKSLLAGIAVGANNTAYEDALIAEGSADDSITDGISIGTVASLVNTYTVVGPCVIAAAPIADGMYDINGNGTVDTCDKNVVEIEIGGLTDLEGHKLSLQIDKAGVTGTPAAAGTADTVGRVKYSTANKVAYMLVEKD